MAYPNRPTLARAQATGRWVTLTPGSAGAAPLVEAAINDPHRVCGRRHPTR